MKNKYSIFGIVLFALFFFPQLIFAATFHFAPATDTYHVGDTFSLTVLVSSTNDAVNAFQSTIIFPSNLLQVTGVSKTSSIVKLWVTEPTFSNAAGTIDFEGVTPNPGFVGAGGRILTITFRVKEAGSATVQFSHGQILANDGNGTDVLTSRGSALFTLVPGEKLPDVPPTEPLSQPKKTSPASTTPVTVGLVPPVIKAYPQAVSTLDVVSIQGTTKYPYSIVTVYFTEQSSYRRSQSVITDKEGGFNFILNTKLTKGIYSVTADVTNQQGIKSLPSNAVVIASQEPDIVDKGWTILQILSGALGILILLILLVATIIYMSRGVRRLRKRVAKDMHILEDAVHGSLQDLHQEILQNVQRLQQSHAGKNHASVEADVFSSFEKQLNILEKLISKKIKTVEKDIGI